MGYIIIFLFILAAILSYTENFIKRYRLFLFIIFGAVLILLAGLREVGIDPDSENYEQTYQHYYASNAIDTVEYSFLLLSQIFNYITDDVHAIFLFYAFFGVMLKFIAFRKYSEFYFLPIVAYLSFYFEVHELTQIRTGIVSAIFLMTIKPIADGNRKKAFLLILLCSFFHISSLTLLPSVFISNKDMGNKQRLIWASLIPASFIMFFAGTNTSISTSIPYIGEKVALYQNATERGVETVGINTLLPLQFVNIAVSLYLLLFHNTIKSFNKYFPIMIKLFIIGICLYNVFAFLPVLGVRLSHLYCIVSIILYTNIYYTIRPKWAGITLVILLSTIVLKFGSINYIGSLFDF